MWLLEYTKLPSLADTVGEEKKCALRTALRSDVNGALKEALDHVRGLDPDYHEGFVLRWTEDVTICATHEEFMRTLQEGIQPVASAAESVATCTICTEPLAPDCNEIKHINGKDVHAACYYKSLNECLAPHLLPKG